MLGVLLILASTLAYNGSAVLLASEARRYPEGSALLLAVGRRFPGALAISLNVLGWCLEVAALTMISLTLARVLNAAGLAVLLGMTRWALKEHLGRREILGVGLVALGIAAVGFAPPLTGGSSPGLGRWALLFAVLAPGIVLPCALKVFGRPAGFALGATTAGLAYALSGILNKGVADNLHAARIVPVATLAACIVAIGIWGFSVELDALRRGPASAVVPVVFALHTVIPIACAPFLFGEVWPVGVIPRVLLGGGVSLTLLGTLALAGSSVRMQEPH